MSNAVNQIPSEPGERIEADRLAGFTHPREATDLIGHDAAQAQLLDAYQSDRLHHGWLITGPEGIGKATLAYRFARFLLSRESERGGDHSFAIEPDCATFRQIAALSHPNLLVLRRPWQEKRGRLGQDITVGEVRGLRTFLGNTAGNAGWRAVIVDRADDLNANAANALLKALEEPPPRCVFLLISSAPGNLPITIRSRCRPLSLAPLNEEDLLVVARGVLAAAGERDIDEAKLVRCALLADGSVGAALQLVANDGIALYDGLYGALQSLPRLDHGALHDFADKLTARGAEARFDLALVLLEGVFTRLMRHAVTGKGAIADEARLSETLMDASSLARWVELWETIQRIRADTVALNLDRKSFVLGTFFRLEETARVELARKA